MMIYNLLLMIGLEYSINPIPSLSIQNITNPPKSSNPNPPPPSIFIPPKMHFSQPIPISFLPIFFSLFCLAINQTPSPSPINRADVQICLIRLVARLRALNGPFLTQKQGIHISLKSMEMYVSEKMTLEQIADYFYYNFNSLGLSPDQCQMLADIYAGIVEIMGNSANATDSLFYGGVGAAIGEIRVDKNEADKMIAKMEGEGRSLEEIELAICRFSLPRITAQRKRQIVMSIARLIPPEKRLAIRDQLRKVIRLD